MMIKGFKNRLSEDIFNGIDSPEARKIRVKHHAEACRVLDRLNVIEDISELEVTPNKLVPGLDRDCWHVALSQDCQIRFYWRYGHAFNVEISHEVTHY